MAKWDFIFYNILYFNSKSFSIEKLFLFNITGHSKESLFLIYINKREDNDANADLFKKFYEDLNKDKKPEMTVVKNSN